MKSMHACYAYRLMLHHSLWQGMPWFTAENIMHTLVTEPVIRRLCATPVVLLVITPVPQQTTPSSTHKSMSPAHHRHTQTCHTAHIPSHTIPMRSVSVDLSLPLLTNATLMAGRWVRQWLGLALMAGRWVRQGARASETFKELIPRPCERQVFRDRVLPCAT